MPPSQHSSSLWNSAGNAQEDSARLRGLAHVNQEVVSELARRGAGERIATIDLDATVIESWKREAKASYKGGSGYQPMVALGAELNVVVAYEFRDGSVRAIKDPLRVAQRAIPALSETTREEYFRGDSACAEEELLSWLRDEKRTNGPQGFNGCAVRARMNPSLRAEIAAIPEDQWQPDGEDSAAIEQKSRRWTTFRKRRRPIATGNLCEPSLFGLA